MKNIEQELKLSLTKREYNILHSLGNGEDVTQENFYYYYDNMPLTTMVRVRRKQDKYTLCFKSAISSRDSVAVNREIECEITKGLADSFEEKGITQQQLSMMLGIVMPQPLRCIGSLITNRKIISINGLNAELDCNNYLGVTDYELECECDDVSRLQSLKHFLEYNYGITAKPSEPKSKRFADTLAGIPMLLEDV